MPELPEVEQAAAIARGVAVGRTITSVDVRHPAQRRGLPPDAARSLAGDRVTAVQRRGKLQFFCLTSGRRLAVHFRMTGDWLVLRPGDPVPPPCAVIGSTTRPPRPRRSRALSVLSLCAAGLRRPMPGPRGHRPGADAGPPAGLLARRRLAIKAALLDQRSSPASATSMRPRRRRARIDPAHASQPPGHGARPPESYPRRDRRRLPSSRPVPRRRHDACRIALRGYDREGAPVAAAGRASEDHPVGPVDVLLRNVPALSAPFAFRCRAHRLSMPPSDL